jgi:hypothetical protein
MCCAYVANATPIRATIPPTGSGASFCAPVWGSRARPMAPRYSQKRRREHWMKAMPCAGIGHDVHEIEIRFEAVRQGFSAFPQLRLRSIEAMFWKRAKRVSVNYRLGSH